MRKHADAVVVVDDALQIALNVACLPAPPDELDLGKRYRRSFGEAPERVL
jgi:hypothetical protein